MKKAILFIISLGFVNTSLAGDNDYLWSQGLCKEITPSGFSQDIIFDIVEAIKVCPQIDDYGEVEKAYQLRDHRIQSLYDKVRAAESAKRRANGQIALQKIFINKLKEKNIVSDTENLKALSLHAFVKETIRLLELYYNIEFAPEYMDSGIMLKMQGIESILFGPYLTEPEKQLDYILSVTDREDSYYRWSKKSNLNLLSEIEKMY